MFKKTIEGIKPIITPWYLFLGVFGVFLVRMALEVSIEPVVASQAVWGYFISLGLLFLAHGFKSAAKVYKESAESWSSIAENMRLCKNELYNGHELLIASGDVFDKLTILEIKKQTIKDENKLKIVEKELSLSRILARNLLCGKTHDFKEEYKKLYMKLFEINSNQWSWEDQVRINKGNSEAAYNARLWNTERVFCKNEINKLFNYPVEVKEYKNENLTNIN